MEDGGGEQGAANRQPSPYTDKASPQGFTLGDKRCSVVLNAGPNVPQLSAKDFFARFMPDSGLTPKQQKEIETRVAQTARDRGRWLAFPLDPNHNDDSEDVAFQGFVDIARAVHDAALYCVPDLKATTKFDNIPDGAPETSNRPNQTRPDGHFVSLAPQSRSVKHPHWVDIAATGEYKKNGTSKKMLTDVSIRLSTCFLLLTGGACSIGHPKGPLEYAPHHARGRQPTIHVCVHCGELHDAYLVCQSL